MDQENIQVKFDQLSGKIKETWGRLSDDDVALAKDKMDQFLGKVQEMYGVTKEAAQKRYDELVVASNYSSDKPSGPGSTKAV